MIPLQQKTVLGGIGTLSWTRLPWHYLPLPLHSAGLPSVLFTLSPNTLLTPAT